MNVLRFFPYYTISQFDQLTIHEYELLMEAHEMSKLDRERDIALQAWENNRIKATKGSGRHRTPVYRSFKDFFNFEERFEDIKAAFHPERKERNGRKLNFDRLIRKKKTKKGGGK